MKIDLQKRVLFALSARDSRVSLIANESGDVFSNRGKVGHPQDRYDSNGYRKVTVWSPIDLNNTNPENWEPKWIGKKVNTKFWVKSEVFEHQIVWIMFMGVIPADRTIDHKNRKKWDNRIKNLRLLDRIDQGKNSSPINLDTVSSSLTLEELALEFGVRCRCRFIIGGKVFMLSLSFIGDDQKINPRKK